MNNYNTQKLIWLPQALDPVTKKCPIYILEVITFYMKIYIAT